MNTFRTTKYCFPPPRHRAYRPSHTPQALMKKTPKEGWVGGRLQRGWGSVSTQRKTCSSPRHSIPRKKHFHSVSWNGPPILLTVANKHPPPTPPAHHHQPPSPFSWCEFKHAKPTGARSEKYSKCRFPWVIAKPLWSVREQFVPPSITLRRRHQPLPVLDGSNTTVTGTTQITLPNPQLTCLFPTVDPRYQLSPILFLPLFQPVRTGSSCPCSQKTST